MLKILDPFILIFNWQCLWFNTSDFWEINLKITKVLIIKWNYIRRNCAKKYLGSSQDGNIIFNGSTCSVYERQQWFLTFCRKKQYSRRPKRFFFLICQLYRTNRLVSNSKTLFDILPSKNRTLKESHTYPNQPEVVGLGGF